MQHYEGEDDPYGNGEKICEPTRWRISLQVQLAPNMTSNSSRTAGLAWKIAALVVAGLLLLIGGSIVGFALLSRDTRQDINLSDIARSDSVFPELSNMREATAELCEGEKGCAQAYEGSQLSLLKFSTQEEAGEAASRHSGSYRSGWIVVVYPDGRPQVAEKTAIEEYVDSLAISE